MDDNAKALIRSSVLEDKGFVRAAFRGPVQLRGQTLRMVVVRPVLVRNQHRYQFSYLDASRDISKNYRPGDARRHLAQILDAPFRSVTVQSTGELLNIQITKSGKAIVHKSRSV